MSNGLSASGMEIAEVIERTGIKPTPEWVEPLRFNGWWTLPESACAASMSRFLGYISIPLDSADSESEPVVDEADEDVTDEDADDIEF